MSPNGRGVRPLTFPCGLPKRARLTSSHSDATLVTSYHAICTSHPSSSSSCSHHAVRNTHEILERTKISFQTASATKSKAAACALNGNQMLQRYKV
eukprot:1151892-Pelagomonas_calceolata.AAC.8